MTYVYRVEKIAQLQGIRDAVLRMGRHFGPPHDYPHAMLETVRKQLPTSKAVYKLGCLNKPPFAVPEGCAVLRIPQRNVLFVEITRVADERAPEESGIYFGVDAAVDATNRLSPNLYIPFKKLDILVGGNWVGLTQHTLAALARSNVARSATPALQA